MMQNIEVTEYTCRRCGYKWINRRNGVDGPIPNRCAKCKKLHWDTPGISPKESGLRRRVRSLKELYENNIRYHSSLSSNVKYDWPDGLIDKFLNLNPRPTIQELTEVLNASVLKLNTENQYTGRGWVTDPTRVGYLKYDFNTYGKILKKDAKMHIQTMQKIIDSRT